MKTNDGREVEFIPYGISMLEHLGRDFTERKEGADTMRRMKDIAGESVTWKHEDFESGGVGPVWIDSAPLEEIDFDSCGVWSPAWFKRADAKRLAKELGAEYVEV